MVTVFTGGTHFLAVLAEEALGAELIAACPVPASVAGDAAAFGHLTGLLALTVPTPGSSQGKETTRLKHLDLEKHQPSCFTV